MRLDEGMNVEIEKKSEKSPGSAQCSEVRKMKLTNKRD